MTRAYVEIIFPLAEVNDPSTKAWFVDGGCNQSYGPGPTTGTLAPHALPHQIGTDTIGPYVAPSPKFLYLEYTVVNGAVPHVPCVGIAGVGFQLENPWTLDVTGTGSTCADGIWWGLMSSGTAGQSRGWPNQGLPFGTDDIAAQGDIIGMAIDLKNFQVWVRNVTKIPDRWYGAGGGPVTTAQVEAYTGGATFRAGGTSPITGDVYLLAGGGFETGTPYEQWSLTNGNLTATTLTTNHTDTIIGVTSHTTGKYYFEMTGGSSADLAWGLTVAGQSPATGIWNGDGTHYGIGLRNDPAKWRINATETASGMTLSGNGKTLAFAIDLTDSKIWVMNVTDDNSHWWGNNASGDPVAGTNGFDISSITGQALYAAFTSNQNGVAESVTINTGGSSFAGTVPSGYSAWDSSDHWSTTFGMHVDLATLTLNSAGPFTGTIPTGFFAWGTETFNPSDASAHIVLSNGNLTVSTDQFNINNQGSHFVRSVGHKAL